MRRQVVAVSLMTVLAVWPLLMFVTGGLLAPLAEQPAGATSASRITFLLQYAIPGALALIVAVQVARARVVPLALRWAPLAALCVYAVPALVELATFATPMAASQSVEIMVYVFGGVFRALAIAGLGVVAIVCAVIPERPANAGVTVYPGSG